MLNSTCMSSDFKVCFSVCISLQYLELKEKCQKQNFIPGKYSLRFKLQFVINIWCMIKIVRGEGVVDGEGGSSERCLKWGGGGSLRDLSKNILKQGWVKAKVVHRGRGFQRCHHPCPPGKF